MKSCKFWLISSRKRCVDSVAKFVDVRYGHIEYIGHPSFTIGSIISNNLTSVQILNMMAGDLNRSSNIFIFVTSPWRCCQSVKPR